MSTSRYARTSWGFAAAITAALVTTMLPGSMSPASAKPPAKPGQVTALVLAATKSGPTYAVNASWNAATRATSYQVKLTNASGTLLDQGKVVTTSFTGHTTLGVGSKVTVTVTPYNLTRRGRATQASTNLPDLTAPVATYTLTPPNSSLGGVTVQQTSLTDDVSAAGAISQSIDWTDGTPASTGIGTVTSFDHNYGPLPAVYHPVVTVTDAAGNHSSYTLTAVVADVVAPIGTFSVSPTSGWAKWTDVTVQQDSLSDDLSAAADITRTIDWGDGTTGPWVSGSTLTHRYSAAGVFIPQVTIADEAGNIAGPLPTLPVTVTADTVVPQVRFTLPQYKRQSVAKWTTLKGRATDVGTGVRQVKVKAIEQRRGVWYAYRTKAQRWVRAPSKATAWTRATPARVTPTATHQWTSSLRGLKTGVLVYKTRGVDNVGNVSAWKAHRQLLTRP